MNRLSFMFIAALLVVGLQTTRAQQKNAEGEKLFASAQHKATIDGDLKGAIQEYEKVVASAGGNRALAAKALISMAECYQKLGDTQARVIYGELVRDYTDQKEVVAAARARLLGSDRIAHGDMTLRKVWVGDTEGRISWDGRSLSYVDGQTGNLALRNLATGANRFLTSDGSWYADFAGNSAISRDSTQVAYGWFVEKERRYELRVVSLQAGSPKPRRLFSVDDISFIEPMDWSPNGNFLAVVIQRKDRTAQIGLIRLQDGALQVLKSVDWRGPTKAFFSPDGRYLGFDLPASDTTTERDVFVLAVDGSREVPAVVSPAQDVMMGWSPSGTHLLFASDRNGPMGLWEVPIVEGKPLGAPALIKANTGSSWSLGVASTGSLYLGVQLSGRDIEVASIDLNTGKPLGPTVRPIQNFTGTNRWLDWSRDGKYLAYVSERGRNAGERVVAIRAIDTGEVKRELLPKLQYFQGLSWAPDGTAFATGGTDLKGRAGVFRIDAQTGEVAPIAIPSAGPFGSGAFRPEWSPDGRSVYYVNMLGAKEYVVIQHDVTSGNERDVTRFSGPDTINLSPDGHWIASVRNDESHKLSAITLIAVNGGETRELLHVTQPESFGRGIGWTPDGHGLIVRKILATDDKGELWLVPIAGGQPHKLDVDVNRMGPLSPIRVHPDGHRLAFFVREDVGDEIWALENFLPALKANR